MRDFKREQKSFDGEKTKMEDILDKVIIVNDYAVLDSKFKKGDKYVLISADLDGQAIVVSTGSGVIQKQLAEEEEEGFPFRTKVTKVSRDDAPDYLTFSAPD